MDEAHAVQQRIDGIDRYLQAQGIGLPGPRSRSWPPTNAYRKPMTFPAEVAGPKPDTWRGHGQR